MLFCTFLNELTRLCSAVGIYIFFLVLLQMREQTPVFIFSFFDNTIIENHNILLEFRVGRELRYIYKKLLFSHFRNRYHLTLPSIYVR